MSDPVTNVEIEDVLSSIRRLVSNEPADSEGGKDFSGAPRRAEQKVENNMDKLVLTQALRVPDSQTSDYIGADQVIDVTATDVVKNDAGAQAKAVFVDASDNSESETAKADTAVPKASLHEIEALAARLANIADDQVKETILQEFRKVLFSPAEPQSDSKNDAEPLAATVASEAETPISEVAEAPFIEVPSEDRSSERVVTLHSTRAEPKPTVVVEAQKEVPVSLEDKIAELEAMIGQTSSDWEPELGDSSDNAAQTSGDVEMPWSDIGADTVDEIIMLRPKISEYTTQTLAVPDVQEVETQAPVEAEVQTEVSAQEAAPVEPEVEAPKVTTPEEFKKAVETPLVGSADRNWPPLRAVPAPADEVVIDEQTLREVVSTVVREELQGAMGERITRNVRKLVRREIQRALTNREFE